MFRIVRLDAHRDFRKAQHFRIGNAEFLPLGVRHRPGEGGAAAAALAVDHADLLAAEPAPQHPAKSLFEGRLVNVELVRIDLALDDGFAKAVTTRDKDHVAKSGFGIEREHDAAGRQIGAHHLHHGDRERHLEMIKALVDAVGNRAIGEDRGKAASAGFEQIVRAAHIEKAVVLAGKARGRQILRGCGTPHRDGSAGASLALELPISFHNLLAQRCRIHRLVDDVRALAAVAASCLILRLSRPSSSRCSSSETPGRDSASR